MEQIKALKELAEKVEANHWVEGERCTSERGQYRFTDIATIAFAIEGGSALRSWEAYNGSLDDAHSLHKAVLGDLSEITIAGRSDEALTYAVYIERYEYSSVFGRSNTMTRAWLLAIIKAKITELEP